jgi:hypothetical protein
MFLKKCPYCKELIKEEAIRCKHCHANLEENANAPVQKTDEGIRYLQNGFEKINSECETIEEKMKLRTGFVFVKHQYSSDELFYAITKIESFVEKMKDDLNALEAANNSSWQVRFQFNIKAEETYHRLESLHSLIEQREPTWWEKVKVILKRIFAKLLSIFPLEMMTGKVVGNLLAAA